MNGNNSNNEFTMKSSISFVLKHKIILIITFFASAIVIGFISLLLPNYYKSQVTIMPAETNAVSKAVLSQMDNYDALGYGKEKNAEHLLELLNSSTILSKTIIKFNLAEHYGIDVDNPQTKSDKLSQKLSTNIKIKRTENLGVKLTVWDTDPFYAANIANFMVSEMQTLRNDIKKAKMDSLLSALTVSRQKLKADIDSLAKEFADLSMQHKIFDPDKMSDRMSQELAKQIASGNQGAISRLENKISEIGQYGPNIIALKVLLERKTETLKIWDEKLEQVRVDAQSNIPTDFIIDSAYASELKDKPKRSVIALVGGICCTLLAIFVLILRDKKTSAKKEDANS
jgi:uncharacterized protein involved in exopolysaccharide biosynthesis